MTTTTQALVVDTVSHRYDGNPVLDDVSLEIEPGEFVTLLGPSGCGKTTLLRIIAGFLSPTSGRIVLGGQDLAQLPPHRRPLNTVFQRPTLFPHLNVFDNVAFGLRVAKVPKREIRSRVEEALELVSLRGMARRRAGEMSGGQMQRVALARALVNRPPVLLLDEPLSALDLKIRLEMESELRRVHAETGASFIYVTHDQREALALSDRIAVLSHGRIEQLAAPDVVYGQPATPFTARFVGDANVLPVVVQPLSPSRVTVHVGTFSFELPYDGDVRGDAWLILRPEAISFTDDPTVAPFEGVVRDVAYRGTGTTFRIAVAGLDDDVKAENAEPLGAHRVGSEVRLTWERESCWLLARSPDGEANLAAAPAPPADAPAAPLRA